MDYSACCLVIKWASFTKLKILRGWKLGISWRFLLKKLAFAGSDLRQSSWSEDSAFPLGRSELQCLLNGEEVAGADCGITGNAKSRAWTREKCSTTIISSFANVEGVHHRRHLPRVHHHHHRCLGSHRHHLFLARLIYSALRVRISRFL